jgi:UDP-N-acetylglucosamine diphosphorylase / glucose-1-phosphate thymidylyltransferase / UDP-N-acetylgalactosamine diphosphorylase / glucosamine-1-phosphate N-acetyltransferase / galactosamine-1-phosphate N-acetyltransferase
MDSEFKDLFGYPSKQLEALFKHSVYPWQMLEKLLEYIHSLPLGLIHGSIDPRADVRDLSLVHLGHGSEIGPGALIEGAVFLGNNVKIRHGAYVRGPVFIDDDCVIGHASEVKHSIFFKNATAAHFNYVGNSILGQNAQLGAGATCANLRFDKKPIIVRTQTKRMPTEHKKMGALIGHDVKIGCQAVLSPGCIVAPQTMILPLSSIQGYYDRKQ